MCQFFPSFLFRRPIQLALLLILLGPPKSFAGSRCKALPKHLFQKDFADIDIFDENDSISKAQREMAVKSALKINKDAIEYIKKQNTSNMANELAALDPNFSNCKWLRVKHIERAGLGHTIACYSFYLKMAVANGLTYHSPFYSPAHDICNLNETTHFFGLHSAYYWAHTPPSDAKIVDVGNHKENKGCNMDTIAKYVSEYKDWQCSQGHIVFLCINENEDIQSRFVKSIEGVETAARAPFWPAFQLHSVEHRVPSVKKAIDAGHVVLVVHMRRGDVLQSRVVDRNHRLVSFGVYENIVKQILTLRKESENININSNGNGNSKSNLLMSIFFLCEGATDSQHIVEFKAVDPHKLYSVDAKATLAANNLCVDGNGCYVEVLHDASFLGSFTTMCEADVLVTSTSGFSWSASALCQPKMTVAIAFSQDYAGIDNVIDIKPSGGLWDWNTKVELPELKTLWHSMLQKKGLTPRHHHHYHH